MPPPSNAANLKRRQILSGLMKLLVLIAFILVSIPFFSSLSSDLSDSEKQRSSRWVAGIAVDDLVAGEVNTLSWSGGEFWIYARTKEDIQALVTLNDEQLRDASSANSDQPDNMNTAFRSANQKYFVFVPHENLRGCQISLSDDRGEKVVFTEPCYQAQFDAAGRIFKFSGKKEQLNLSVPQHVIENGQLKIGIWTPAVN